jgi:hypothetical protein
MESGSFCLVRKTDYATPEEGARLIYEDLKKKIQPRLALAAMDRKQR